MSKESSKKSKNHNVEEYVSLLTENQARIYSYILSLIPNFNDADDILQDTTKLMWEKFEQYRFGTDFLAWGRKIAYFLVLEYYRKKKKDISLFYDEQFILKLEKNSERISDSSREYLFYLNGCVNKLKHKDKKLLKLKYYENKKTKELASRFGCSVQYVYRNISRIHQLLLACVERQVKI